MVPPAEISLKLKLSSICKLFSADTVYSMNQVKAKTLKCHTML